MSTSGFLYRDIIQLVLPTLIGLFLFAPIIGLDFNRIDLLTLSIVLGFLTSSFIGRIRLIERFFLSSKSRHLGSLVTEAWDLNLMFYSLNKDDRDYLYLSGSYLRFYINTTTYLIVYLVYNLLILAFNFDEFLEVKTVLIGGYEVNAILVIVMVALFSFFLTKDYKAEYDLLFLPENQYDKLAEKTQAVTLTLDIAKSVWGTIDDDYKNFIGHEVFLNVNGIEVGKAKIDRYGYFIFKDLFDKCNNQNVSIFFNGKSTVVKVDKNKSSFFKIKP